MPTTIKQPVLFQAPWKAPSNIKTCITTRTNDFNLATHVNDDPEKVALNRKLLQKQLPAAPLWLNQTHSTEIIDIAIYHDNNNTPNADAAYTTDTNKVCVVMTADCLPVLLSNQQGEFIAAIHAGWRGLNNGIIENTLSKLSDFKADEMIAFIGPAICQNCFEVGDEIREAFTRKIPQVDKYFKEGVIAGKQLANLRKIAEYILVNSGLNINNISNSDICTRCNQHWFYSYRANPDTGRIATLIWKT